MELARSQKYHDWKNFVHSGKHFNETIDVTAKCLSIQLTVLKKKPCKTVNLKTYNKYNVIESQSLWAFFNLSDCIPQKAFSRITGMCHVR